MLVMYDQKSKNFKTSLTDARGAFPSYTNNVAGKNSFIVTLQAREDIEFSSGKITYKADEDAEVRFGILLGASGGLGDHTGPILLHKNFYWPDNKAKTGSANTTTVLAGLRQWAATLGVANINTYSQPNLCQAIEEKL
jgi:hypothetical protein